MGVQYNQLKSSNLLIIYILLGFILHLVSAFFSIGFYSDDEHFQILEPVAHLMGLNNVIIGIAVSWFPWYVRIARSQALVIRSMDYVLLSKSMGSGNIHVMRKHILPNSLSPIIVQASIDAGYAILISAGLSFIGLGAQPPEAEWGLLITQSRAQFLNHWWVVTFPGLFIVGTVLSFNMIGDELRNVLNPRLAKQS